MPQIETFLSETIDWQYVLSILLVNQFFFILFGKLQSKKRYLFGHLVFPNPDAQAKAWITVINSILIGLVFWELFKDTYSEKQNKYAINLVLTFCITTTLYDLAVKKVFDILGSLLISNKTTNGEEQGHV